MPESVGGITVYTIKEISRKLNTTAPTLQRKIREGKIRATKIGNKWHITEEALRDFLEGKY